MKLNYKTSIIIILCFSAVGLTGLTRADSKSELQAEIARFDAAIVQWNSQCKGHHANSPEGPRCLQEGARLDAWRASLQARFNARKQSKSAEHQTSSTTSDAFGTRKSNPKVVPAEKGTIGPNTNPGDQLKAAAKEARRGDQSDLRKNYDEGGAQSDGSLVAAHTLSAGPLPIDLSHFSERAKKDPEIVASLNNLSKLESKRMRLNTELNQLTAQRNAAKDPGTMKELTKKVDQENKVKQANLVEITNTIQEIEKRHRKIDY